MVDNSDKVFLLKKILVESNNPELILSSAIKKLFVKHTGKTSGFYDFTIWLEVFDFLLPVKGKTYRKTFKPNYKKIDSYAEQNN